MNVNTCIAAALSVAVTSGLRAQGVLMSLNHDNQGLGLAATYLNSEFYTMVGENGTTPDGYASGVADLDCFGERFFYVLANPYRLVTLDAVTGELLGNVAIDNAMDADVPASNIAYDWTDDKLYGIAHSYNAGTDIQLICIDPETGSVEAVGDDPDDDASFGSGNCDIDALGNRYFMFAGGKLKVWDTGTGAQTVNVSLPTLFGASNLESWTHPMYHPVEDLLYALHMLQPESYDFNGPPFQTELRLARLHPETAEVEWFTPSAISMDGIQSGVCDLDPFNNRVFYQRVDGMKIFSTDGTALSTISSPSNSISPWANVQYHDLSTPPTAVVGEDSDGQTVEWDGTSSLTLSHGLGNAVAFDGWTGMSGESSMNQTWTVGAYGTVHVHGHRQGESGETVDVRRTFHVVPHTVDNQGELSAQPCPSSAAPVEVFDLGGRSLGTFSGAHWATQSPTELGLPRGVIFAHQKGCGTRKLRVH